jgi:hypothetical protein
MFVFITPGWNSLPPTPESKVSKIEMAANQGVPGGPIG